MMDIFAVEDRYTSGLYTKRPVAILRGQGARLWDSEGASTLTALVGRVLPISVMPTRTWLRPLPNRLTG